MFHLPDVKKLVGQVQQAGGVGLDGEHVLPGAVLVPFCRDDLVQRHLDEREGSAYLVGEVGEILDLCVIDLSLLVVLHPGNLVFAFHFLLSSEFCDQKVQEQQRQQQVD